MSWAERSIIDVHVHVTEQTGGSAIEDRLLTAAAERFRSGPHRSTVEDIIEYYDARDMAAVVFAVDSESGTGRASVRSEVVLAAARKYPDTIIPFGSVDPWRGRTALTRVSELIDAGVRGFKFQPSTQAFFPNDQRFYPIYQLLADAKVIALFHTGQTGVGAGLPGGGGIKLRYSHPMCIDDVAADFPELTIVMAHPSVPWQDEALAVALHKANVFMDLSGWSPKYFEPKLVHYAKRMITTKVLFGSDFPLIKPDRWLADFRNLGFDDDQAALILRGNAVRILKGAGA